MWVDPAAQLRPVDVLGLMGAVALSAGDQHTCALLMDGAVKCWGSNGSGQLGTGSTDLSASPVDVTQLPVDVVGLTAGSAHKCARTASGGAKCWGRNFDGQSGIGATSPRRC